MALIERLQSIRAQILDRYSEPLKERIPAPIRRVLDENAIFFTLFTQFPVRIGGHALNAFYLYQTATNAMPLWTTAIAAPLTNAVGLGLTYGSLLYYGTQRDELLHETFRQVRGLAQATVDYYGDRYIELDTSLSELLHKHRRILQENIG